MRAPGFIKHTGFYQKLKRLPWYQRGVFFVETYGTPGSLKDVVKKVNWSIESQEEYQVISEIELLRGDLERSEELIEGSSIGKICKVASKNSAWCKLMFHIVRKFRPESCVEMGTCLGVSGAFIAAALRLNGSGRLVTLEGSVGRADAARANFRKLKLDNVSVVSGDFRSTLSGALEDAAPVDLVFVDGHHDGKATVDYFNLIRPKLSKKNIIIFDDIRWSDGMREAWKHIHSRTSCIDLGPVGICIDVQD